MKISVLHRLYNAYGGQKSISMSGYWLEHNSPEFGSAIDEIEIIMHFYHDGPARKSLESMQEEFHQALKSLPKSKFLRKKKRLTLEIEGTFIAGYEIERQSKPPIQINPAWVKSALNAIVEELPFLEKKLKKSDDFDFKSFKAYCHDRLSALPSTIEELQPVYDEVLSGRKAAFEKLDPWEKLDISWEEYHEAARILVPDPFLWSVTDEFAPNGNDTGADTLELFKEWNKKNKSISTMEFLSKLMGDWEIDIQNPYTSEYSSYTYFQATVGLAFASAKIRGECEDELKKIAGAALDHQINTISGDVGWEFKDECENKLAICKSTIEKMA
ncbi:hypothetical protein [Grimontia sp. NTOU-MAR1]|uniref:hypothetical protein n=1 Tax=Grimontia sp. NTOU-MAR1 TaxID=3111011 RepID=UPI002DBCB093|nr:hypothetical protein [Grimontia sp. NTOU-MAR1]WRV98529.1 hypothetical protein VP504_03575 [Grimontia sp. NTOU-MAR1]